MTNSWVDLMRKKKKNRAKQNSKLYSLVLGAYCNCVIDTLGAAFLVLVMKSAAAADITERLK